jgi:hypothetical protein
VPVSRYDVTPRAFNEKRKDCEMANPKGPNFFFVDGKQYQTEKVTINGAEIKALANVLPNYQLFLEVPGDDPDRAFSDAENIDASEKPPKHFYAVPPATFGTR